MKKIICLLLAMSMFFCMGLECTALNESESRITSPDNNEWFDPCKPITVKWTAPGQGLSNKITIKNEKTGDYFVQNKKVSGTSYTIGADVLDYEEAYKIWVGTFDGTSAVGAGSSVTIKIWSQKDSAKKYSEAEFTYPSNGQRIKKNESVTLEWTGDSALAYNLTVRDVTSDKVIVTENNLTKRSYTIKSSLLEAGHEYKVWIGTYRKASYEAMLIGKGDTISFKITGGDGTEPPKRPELEPESEPEPEPEPEVNYEAAEISSPSNKAWLDPTEKITIRWNETASEAEYKLTIKDDVSGEYIIRNKSVTSTSYTIRANTLTAEQRYKVTLVTYIDDEKIGDSDSIYINMNSVDYPEASFAYPLDGDEIDASKKLTIKLADTESDMCYRISIVDEDSGKTILRNKVVSGNKYTVSANTLQPDREYKLWVGTFVNEDASEAVGVGEVIYIYTEDEEIEEPEVAEVAAEFTYPSDNAKIDYKKDVTLKWSAADISTNYVLAVRDITADSYVVKNVSVSGTSYKITASKLKAGHEYKAWIGTCKNKNDASFIGAGDVVFFNDNSTTVTIKSVVGEVDENGLTFKYVLSGTGFERVFISVENSSGKTIYENEKYEMQGEITVKTEKLSNGQTYSCTVRAYGKNGSTQKVQKYTVAKSGFSTTGIVKPVGSLNYEKANSEGFTVGGIVGSAYPIKEAEIIIFTKGNEADVKDVVRVTDYHKSADSPTKFNIYDYDSQVNFGLLDLGEYTYRVSVVDVMGSRYIAASSDFKLIIMGSYSSSANEMKIYDFCRNVLKLNTAATVAIIANIEKESNFDPNEYGDYENGVPTSYGICQWHDGRWTRLKNFCSENGYDYQSLSGQLYYLKSELQEVRDYKSVWDKLNSVSNTAEGAYEAAAYWCAVFEVPSGWGERDSSGKIIYGPTSIYRANIAKNVYWPKYSGYVTVEAQFKPLTASSPVPYNKDLTLEWTKAEKDTTYVISVRDLTSDSLIINNKVVTGTSCTIKARSLKKDHEYRAWIGTHTKKNSKEFVGGGSTLMFNTGTPAVKYDVTYRYAESVLNYKPIYAKSYELDDFAELVGAWNILSGYNPTYSNDPLKGTLEWYCPGVGMLYASYDMRNVAEHTPYYCDIYLVREGVKYELPAEYVGKGKLNADILLMVKYNNKPFISIKSLVSAFACNIAASKIIGRSSSIENSLQSVTNKIDSGEIIIGHSDAEKWEMFVSFFQQQAELLMGQTSGGFIKSPYPDKNGEYPQESWVNNKTDWCVAFATWLAGDTMLKFGIEQKMAESIVPYELSTGELIRWYTDGKETDNFTVYTSLSTKGMYFKADENAAAYIPKVGDFIVVETDKDSTDSTPDHTGIVYSVDWDNKSFVAIEGNTGKESTENKKVKKHTYTWNGEKYIRAGCFVYGFLRPDYMSAVSKMEISEQPESAEKTTQVLDGSLLSPLKGVLSVTRSSNRTNEIKCDFVAAVGTPIYAPTDGTVTYMQVCGKVDGEGEYKLISYGNYVIFKSSDGIYTLRLCHLNSFAGITASNLIPSDRTAKVSTSTGSKWYNKGAAETKETITVNQQPINVSQGDLIGYTGETGNAHGPHLHMELYKNGNAVNPIEVFKNWN